MRKVIVNSTPLIILCNIGKLEILKEMYGEVVIPQAVYTEVTVKKDSACQQVVSADWIHVEQVKDHSEKKMYKAKLHEGEVEVMMLAQETGKEALVVIDDNAAKKTAKYLGLTVTGTAGVLLKAKKRGILPEIRPVLESMKRKGFYISGNVEQMILEQAKEQLSWDLLNYGDGL